MLNFKVISLWQVALIIMEAELETIRTQPTITSAFDRAALFEELYESAFPIVASFVRKMNGSFEDAKDIFQDALVIYYEKVSEGSLSIDVPPSRYILGIARHLWLRKFKNDRNNVSLDDFEKSLLIPDDFYPTASSLRILQFLETAGNKCMELLRVFYFERLAIKDIVSKLGYGSEHSASVQKYKCLEKIRGVLKEKSVTYEDFFE